MLKTLSTTQSLIAIQGSIKKSVLFILCLFHGFSAIAEEWPTFSIAQLSVFANKVVEGHFLYETDGQYYFLVSDIHQKQGRKDTLELNHLRSSYYDTNYFKRAKSIIFYLLEEEEQKPQLCLSGVRLLVDGKIYYPYQVDNPGNYHLFGSDKMTWNQLQTNIVNTDKRIQAVKALQNISDFNTRNVLLLEWMEKNISSFGIACSFDDDCGWGGLEMKVLEWICEAESAEDTWRAGQLYHTFSYSYKNGPKSILNCHYKNSFKTQAEVDFLIDKAIDPKTPQVERRQALRFLERACRIVYQLSYQRFAPLSLDLQKTLQQQYRSQLLPLLDDLELRYLALPIILALSNPRDHSLRHRIDLGHLDQLIDHFQKLKQSSYFRDQLSTFIAYNSTEEQWKKLTGNDQNMLINLGNIYVDTVKQQVSFGIRRTNGKEAIHTMPQLILNPLGNKDNRSPINLPLLDFPLPHDKGDSIRLYVDTANIPKGKWQFYVKGTAGEKNQFQWTSLVGNFEIK